MLQGRLEKSEKNWEIVFEVLTPKDVNTNESEVIQKRLAVSRLTNEFPEGYDEDINGTIVNFEIVDNVAKIIPKEVEQPLTDFEKEFRLTEQDIYDAVQYGFKYATESQNDGVAVPKGNVLQWLYSKKGYNPYSPYNKSNGESK